tara:strand:- start:1368 stop:1595 length:228 start_codon:yes stop_codon:yes gene_type:complete
MKFCTCASFSYGSIYYIHIPCPENMSHHKKIIVNGMEFGHMRVTNNGEVLSIWIVQPWGEGELFIPETGLREEDE